MKKLSLVLFVALLTSNGLAYHGLALDGQSGSTSDKLDYEQIRIQFSENKTNLHWPLKRESEGSFEWDLQYRFDESKNSNIRFNYSEASAGLALKLWKKHKLSFRAGVGEVKQNRKSAQGVGEIKYEGRWLPNLGVTLKADHSLSAPLILPLNGNATEVFAQGFSSQINYTLLDSWDFQLQTLNHFLLDGNQRNAFDVQAMYALARFPHWIRFGLGTSYLSYQKRSPNYWTPRRLSSYGPRIDLSFQLVENFNAFAGGSINLFQEDSFTPGDGHYVKAGLRYGNRENWQLSAAFENGESIQNNNLWYSHFYSINASVFW